MGFSAEKQIRGLLEVGSNSARGCPTNPIAAEKGALLDETDEVAKRIAQTTQPLPIDRIPIEGNKPLEPKFLRPPINPVEFRYANVKILIGELLLLDWPADPVSDGIKQRKNRATAIEVMNSGRNPLAAHLQQFGVQRNGLIDVRHRQNNAMEPCHCLPLPKRGQPQR